MKLMNGKGAVDDDGSDDYDDGGDEEGKVEEIEDPKEGGDDDEEEGVDKEWDEEKEEEEDDDDDDEVEEVNPPNGAQIQSVSDDDDDEEEDEDDEGGDDSDDGEEEDMGTEYLVRPICRTEDKEDASNFKPGELNGKDDFEPGDFKKFMMKVMQYTRISVCLHEQLEWQELHYPILHLIMEKLSFPDFIRSASVCSWWRQVQRTSPVRLCRPRLPWLINKDTRRTETHTIFNHSGMSHDIDIPGTRLTSTIGCAYGWLLYEYQGGREYFLLNPITNSRIKLPGSFPVKSYSMVSHAVISTDPSTTDLEMVIIMFMINNALVFCRPIDSGWSTIETGEPFTSGPNSWADMVACNGKIYVLMQHGKFGCINVSYNNCCSVEWLIDEDRGGMRWRERSYCRARFLVESLGDILLVLAYEDSSFKIYKADVERMTWIEGPDLGDRILFLGRCCSLSASDPELTCGEKIYMSYPGDYKKRMNEISAARSPEQADRLWTWKLASIHSKWHWMLPSC